MSDNLAWVLITALFFAFALGLFYIDKIGA